MKIDRNIALGSFAAIFFLTGCGGGGGCSDANCASGSAVPSTSFVTTASAIAISIGFDGTASSVDQDKRYAKTFVVAVADQNGFAVKGAVVTPEVSIPFFRKGFFERDADLKLTGYEFLECKSEDLNGDDELAAPETDVNGDGELTPRQSLVTVTPTSAATDENGVAYFQVRYFKSHAGWLNYRFRANTSVQTTQGSASESLVTGFIAGDEEQVSAPFISSPFGIDISACTNFR
jgi:hypothetical protein